MKTKIREILEKYAKVPYFKGWIMEKDFDNLEKELKKYMNDVWFKIEGRVPVPIEYLNVGDIEITSEPKFGEVKKIKKENF